MKRITMTRPAQLDEQGFASLIVGMILVLVVSLITVGYGQLVNNEQQQTTDKQLSTQAFYAAESGVNDAIKYLRNGTLTNSVTSCGSAPFNTSNVIDAANGVGYTCVLVSQTVPALTYSDIGSDLSTHSFTGWDNAANAPTNVGYINISWQCNDSNCLSQGYQSAASKDLPSKSNWGNTTDALEMKLTPLNSYSRNNLINTSATAILYPNDGSGVSNQINFDNSQANQGSIVHGDCKTGAKPYACNVTIKMSGAGVPGGGIVAQSYALSLRGLYGTGDKVSVSLEDSSGKAIDSKGGQILIDSTGKAQNVVKRIQVHVPVDSNNSFPSGALTGSGICKRIVTYPGGTTVDLPNIDSSQASAAQALCSPGDPVVAQSCSAAHDIVLVLDASSSMTSLWTPGTRQQELEKVADTFVDNAGLSPTGNNVAVVSFNTLGRKDIGYSSSASDIKTAISKPFNGSGTGYLAGLNQAQTILDNGRPGVQPVVIFISDGRPDTDTPQQILNQTNFMKSKQGVLIYAIGIADSGNIDTNILSNMASNPQSTYYTTATSHTDFESFFGGISNEVKC